MRTIENRKYMVDDPCGLEEPDRVVNSDFVAVLYHAAAEADFDVKVGCSGCTTCFHTTRTGALFWIAQGDSIDKMHVKHDHASLEHDDLYLAELVEKWAGELDVPVSFPPNEAYTIVLGESDYYDAERFNVK